MVRGPLRSVFAQIKRKSGDAAMARRAICCTGTNHLKLFVVRSEVCAVSYAGTT